LQDVAIEIVGADNLMAKTTIELHFVLHVESSLTIGGWCLTKWGEQKMSVVGCFDNHHSEPSFLLIKLDERGRIALQK